MKKDRFDLTYEDILQKTMVWQTYGFRTLTQTACLHCKHGTRKIEHHLEWQLPVNVTKDFKVMNSHELIKNFNPWIIDIREMAKQNSLCKKLLSCFNRNSSKYKYDDQVLEPNQERDSQISIQN